MIFALSIMMLSAFGADVRICGQWTPDLKDVGYPDDDGEDANGDGIDDNDIADRLTTNSPLKAHGLEVQVQTRDGFLYPWNNHSVHALEVAGPNGGCTPELSISPPFPGGNTQVRLIALSKVHANGHEAVIYKDDVVPLIGQTISSIGTVYGASTRVDVDLGSGDPRFDAAIIIAWSLNREDGDGPDMDLDVYTCNAPPSDENCLHEDAAGGVYKHSSRTLYVGDQSSGSTLIHELGHAVAANAMANTSNHWDITYDWTNHGSNPDSVCDISADNANLHERDSDEATSAAITEGYADYYWAQIVNRLDQDDCFLRGKKYDWDHDGIEEDNRWFSCAIQPLPSLSVDEDFWADNCSQTGVESVASEYDWLRGLWDLDTVRGMTYTDLVNVLSDAAPDTWTEDWVESPATCTGDCPWSRMLTAAAGLGFQQEWNYECSNGICR